MNKSNYSTNSIKEMWEKFSVSFIIVKTGNLTSKLWGLNNKHSFNAISYASEILKEEFILKYIIQYELNALVLFFFLATNKLKYFVRKHITRRTPAELFSLSLPLSFNFLLFSFSSSFSFFILFNFRVSLAKREGREHLNEEKSTCGD